MASDKITVTLNLEELLKTTGGGKAPLVLDPGHKYLLPQLDGLGAEVLTFVKRNDPPTKFPGNDNAYPGTTLQAVLRCVLERLVYLQGQDECDENIAIIQNVRSSIYLLEHRAMRRHGLDASSLTIREACELPMCPKCGHVRCRPCARMD